MIGSMFSARGWLCMGLMLCVSISHSQDRFAGRVTGVSDGDTIRVVRQGREERVRLWGVDAPETGQPFSAAAKKAVSDAVFNRSVTVEVRDTDRYGRLVGWVTFDSVDARGRATKKSLNLELVRMGMAWHYVQFAPRADDLRAAERQARAAKTGLWSAARPVPPWDWRRGS
jgi:micrococcal nuclease